MAGRDGEGKVFSPGSRKRDRTVDDALRTMERLGQWLETAREEVVWQQLDDPFQVAMLHGMLHHLQREIEHLLALGGQEVEQTVLALRTLAAHELLAAAQQPAEPVPIGEAETKGSGD